MKPEIPVKKRLRYLDIARGIAMLCIIAGHFGIVSVNRVVYTFHVPLFFLLSGFFFSDKGEDWATFLLSKAKQLMLPYAIGCLGIAVSTCIWFVVLGWAGDIPERLVHIACAALGGAGTLHETPIRIVQIGALWFLPALFFGYCTLRLALKTRLPGVVLIAAALASCLSARWLWLPMSVQPGIVAALFLYMGYYARKKELLASLKPWIFACCCVVWVLCVMRGYSLNIVSLEFVGGPVSVVSAICASYVIVCVAYMIDRMAVPVAARFLNYFGQITLGVLVFHAIADFTFPWYLVYGVMTGAGVPRPIQHIVVVALNVLWPLVAVAAVKYVPPVGRVLVPRTPIPLPKGTALSEPEHQR